MVSRALYNFQAQNYRELSFKKGDLVYIRRQVIWFHSGLVRIIIPQKCGGIGSNEFHIKWIIGTQGNWKNQNPGGRFWATN